MTNLYAPRLIVEKTMTDQHQRQMSEQERQESVGGIKEENNGMKAVDSKQKDKMERKRTADINLVKESHRAEREKLEEEIDYLTQQVENLKARNSESFILAENSRSTAEKLARTEEGVAEEEEEWAA